MLWAQPWGSFWTRCHTCSTSLEGADENLSSWATTTCDRAAASSLYPSFFSRLARGAARPTLFRVLVGDDADHPGDLEGDVLESGGLRRPGGENGDRDSGVRLLPDQRIDGHLAEELRVERLRRPLSSALREDVGLFSAMRASEVAHVLHHSQDGHVQLPEHRQS